MMPNKLSTARADLKTTLQALGYIVYSAPVETMTPPCLILVPASPYASIVTVGSNPKMIMSLNVTLCVAANDNQAALTNLDAMIANVSENLPTGIRVGDFTQPKITQVGPNDLLTADIQFDVTI
jgi:hypothetical protein